MRQLFFCAIVWHAIVITFHFPVTKSPDCVKIRTPDSSYQCVPAFSGPLNNHSQERNITISNTIIVAMTMDSMKSFSR